MDEDSQLFVYSSEDDRPLLCDVVNDGKQSKKRGPGRKWCVTTLHESLARAVERIGEYNVPTVTRLKGRTNRGKTASYYFYCSYKSCGCTKEWRLVTKLDSFDVTEEESIGDHSCHELFERNGGRGLSTIQVQIVDEAFMLGMSKPSIIIEFFNQKEKVLLAAGTLYKKIVHLIILTSKFAQT